MGKHGGFKGHLCMGFVWIFFFLFMFLRLLVSEMEETQEEEKTVVGGDLHGATLIQCCSEPSL